MRVASTSNFSSPRSLTCSLIAGLNSLAIRHYEAVLDEERHRREAEMEALPGGLAKYAAYNLYLVYLTSGVGELAKRVSDEWLAF